MRVNYTSRQVISWFHIFLEKKINGQSEQRIWFFLLTIKQMNFYNNKNDIDITRNISKVLSSSLEMMLFLLYILTLTGIFDLKKHFLIKNKIHTEWWMVIYLSYKLYQQSSKLLFFTPLNLCIVLSLKLNLFDIIKTKTQTLWISGYYIKRPAGKQTD